MEGPGSCPTMPLKCCGPRFGSGLLHSDVAGFVHAPVGKVSLLRLNQLFTCMAVYTHILGIDTGKINKKLIAFYMIRYGRYV